MVDKPMSEQERRELAEAHKDDFDPDYAAPITPRRLEQMVSLRLDPDVVVALRELAVQRGCSVSDLLREGAARVLAAAAEGMRVTHMKIGVDVGWTSSIIDTSPVTGSLTSVDDFVVEEAA